MFRYYVRMRKGEKEIYKASGELALILKYIRQQKEEGFKVIESNVV